MKTLEIRKPHKEKANTTEKLNDKTPVGVEEKKSVANSVHHSTPLATPESPTRPPIKIVVAKVLQDKGPIFGKKKLLLQE